jgi:hypothetical protein
VLTCFAQQTRTLITRPGAHTGKSTVDQTHGSKAIERRIDPAVERNIRRTLICRRVRALAAKDLADGTPSCTTELRVMMAGVNVLRYEIADHAADDHVGGEMLARFHARNINQRRQAVCKDFRKRTGIFMSHDSGNGPGRC